MKQIKLKDSKNQNLITSVSKEVKVYSIEEHTSNLNDIMSKKWNQINEQINELEGIELIPKRHYIGLVLNGSTKSTICYLKFRKSCVRMAFPLLLLVN